MKIFSKIKFQNCILISMLLLVGCKNNPEPPAPFGPVPSSRQVEWHDTDFYSFIHFTINTFTNKEWGYGDESPELFNPTAFDAEQIVLTCKNAGMKGLVLTAKHHDGFCLWPTKTTEHNISKSPFKNGEGDIVREIADACCKHGLKLGIYISPWDRHNANYGKPEYIDVFKAQLTELLTQYGEIFEVWFDGANGGTGYYGGANENREIDRVTYYGWDEIFKIIRELQPTAAIFSDIGPDARWIGTEEGYSGDPCWHRYTPEGREDGVPPGMGQTKYWESINGHRDGEYWMPAETNTSIRPGWFYHASEDDKVKTPERLVKLYYESLGHGTTLILNLPPDRRGLINEIDVASLTKFKEIIDATFSKDLTEGATFTASNIRGKSQKYDVVNLHDDNQQTYWATDDDVLLPEVVVEFPDITEFNVVNIREYIPIGQRIWGWALDRWEDDQWIEFAKAESVGHRRLWKGSLQTTKKIRLRITEAAACPAITRFSVHLEPVRLEAPVISRDKMGNVSITSNAEIRYTIDGSQPSQSSELYVKAIPLPRGGVLKAAAYYQEESSSVTTASFSQSKSRWEVETASSYLKSYESFKSIDTYPSTFWQSENGDKQMELTICLGEELHLKAFTMLPRQDGKKEGLITHYEFFTSDDGENWNKSVSGEFSNIHNNPIEQRVEIEPVNAKYIRLKATKTVGGEFATIAELGVYTK
ncbi:alpha-L-fucosidase [uncultured Draconibacterium sp.]|uniref:alpha-L-fucosidase n=1 Tax=uncultured Draconibacterium sp. TaxID=1573823 RepID=UPI0032601269